MGYLVEDLLVSVKKRSFAPTSQQTFDDASLIEVANDELLLNLVSEIMEKREDFFLARKTVSLVANVQNYGIPERSVGNALKAVFRLDSGGRLSPPLPRTDIDMSDSYSIDFGDPQKFYFEGDEVALVPAPGSSGGRIELAYYRRPNRLVSTAECAKITAITEGVSSVTFTVDTDLTSTLEAGEEVDILSAKSPFLLWSADVEIEAITTTTIQVPLASVINPAGIVEPQVGDYICERMTANIPMIPIEYHMVLAQQVAVSMLHSLGDLEKLRAAEARLERMKIAAGILIKNRAESAPELLIQRNNLARTLNR